MSVHLAPAVQASPTSGVDPTLVRRVATLFGGERLLAPETILRFVEPMMGFEAHQDVFIYVTQDGPMSWLQAVDDASVTFCLINPFLAGIRYDLEIGHMDAAELGADSADAIEVHTLVVLDRDPKQIRTNLRAPILVCRRSGRIRQLILDDPRLPIRYLLSDLAKGLQPGRSSESARSVAC
jgi:flagellar assembly factor FliW